MLRNLSLPLAAALAVALFLPLACGPAAGPAAVAGAGPAVDAAAATAPPARPATAARAAAAPAAAAVPAADSKGELTFTGSREETARFIRYYQEIRLAPVQEQTKAKALSAIPAPCCSENSLATCCCPCNMAKAAWGLSAWLITQKGYGVDELRQAAREWLAAANPDGFTGDACHSGGCARPIHQNGCGGMDDRRVL